MSISTSGATVIMPPPVCSGRCIGTLTGRAWMPRMVGALALIVSSTVRSVAAKANAAGHRCTPGPSGAVVRMALQDGRGAIDLLGQHDAHEHVRPGHGAERQHQIGALENGVVE